MTRILVLSDTHAPRRWKSCPPAVAVELRSADLILHAGDVCTAGVLSELSGYAPVKAVMGNNDGPDVASWGAPETLTTDIEGLTVGMIHDSGQATGRLARMRRRFPSAALVIFGHSHNPLDASDGNGFRIFNPGSPTDRRRQPHGTIGILEVDGGELRSARILPVSLPAVAVDYLVEGAAVRVADQGEWPVRRVPEWQQVGAVSVRGESEQFPGQILIADRRVPAADAQPGGRDRHAHQDLPQVEEDPADLPGLTALGVRQRGDDRDRRRRLGDRSSPAPHLGQLGQPVAIGHDDEVPRLPVACRR